MYAFATSRPELSEADPPGIRSENGNDHTDSPRTNREFDERHPGQRVSVPDGADRDVGRAAAPAVSTGRPAFEVP